MNGIVIIRTGDLCCQIHRSLLTYVQVKGTRVQWNHVGDTEQEIDIDILQDDRDATNYEEVARDVFMHVIADVLYDATITWDAVRQAWVVAYAPAEVNLTTHGDLSEDLVGFGSLGR